MPVRFASLLMALVGLCVALFPAFSSPLTAEVGNNPVLLRSVEITATIDNAYAITEIRQTLENTINDSAEAFFNLLIPKNAFISNFSLTIGNLTYYAEVLRKDEAQERYNQSVASKKTAGLGQTRDTKRFSFAVNLKGGQSATVALRYEHNIPLFLGERRYELYLSSMDMSTEEFHLCLTIGSAAGLSGLKIENYEDMVEQDWENSHNLTISLEGEDFTPENDFAVVYTEQPPPLNGTILGHYDRETGEYYFFNIFSPEKSNVGGGFSKDIVFVLDKSGSMTGEKIAQLKQAFGEIVDQLPEDDRFGIIMFDSHITVYTDELIDASEENKEDAKNYLNGISAGGSTNLNDGLEKALGMLTYSESRAPIIVMLTDGLANTGRYASPVPIRENIATRNNIFCPIFTLGFGDNVDFEFLTALSLENYAKAQKIHIGEDASEQIVNFYETISTTLLKTIEIDYPEAAYDYFPESIPALYEGSESIIVGKINLNDTDGSFTTSFSAYGPEGKREFNSTYSVGENDTNNSFIKRFWAYAKIFSLMDELTLRSGKERDAIISEIENLSIEAHFVTPYTSLYLEIEEGSEGETIGEGQNKDDNQQSNNYGGGSSQSNFNTYSNSGGYGSGAPTPCSKPYSNSASSKNSGGCAPDSAPPPSSSGEANSDDGAYALSVGAIGVGLVLAAIGKSIITKRRRRS